MSTKYANVPPCRKLNQEYKKNIFKFSRLFHIYPSLQINDGKHIEKKK